MSNKQALYLNLLFKALKADHDSAHIAAFVRWFTSRAGAAGTVEFVAGGLYLLGEVCVPRISGVPRLTVQSLALHINSCFETTLELVESKISAFTRCARV